MRQNSFEAGKIYHVYNRGNNKENIFMEVDNYRYFLSLLKKYLTPIAIFYSYCLLPNHFHFIIKIKEQDALSMDYSNGKKKLHQPFSNLFNAYTKAINKRHQRSGSLFQEHLKRKEVTSEEYLQQLIVYVNTNPAHHKIADYERYKFSSYQALISDKPTIIKRRKVIDLFDTIENLKYMHQIKKIDLELMRDLMLE